MWSTSFKDSILKCMCLTYVFNVFRFKINRREWSLLSVVKIGETKEQDFNCVGTTTPFSVTSEFQGTGFSPEPESGEGTKCYICFVLVVGCGSPMLLLPLISFRMCKSSVIAIQLGRKFVTLPAINLGGFIKEKELGITYISLNPSLSPIFGVAAGTRGKAKGVFWRWMR